MKTNEDFGKTAHNMPKQAVALHCSSVALLLHRLKSYIFEKLHAEKKCPRSAGPC